MFLKIISGYSASSERRRGGGIGVQEEKKYKLNSGQQKYIYVYGTVRGQYNRKI